MNRYSANINPVSALTQEDWDRIMLDARIARAEAIAAFARGAVKLVATAFQRIVSALRAQHDGVPAAR